MLNTVKDAVKGDIYRIAKSILSDEGNAKYKGFLVGRYFIVLSPQRNENSRLKIMLLQDSTVHDIEAIDQEILYAFKGLPISGLVHMQHTDTHDLKCYYIKDKILAYTVNVNNNQDECLLGNEFNDINEAIAVFEETMAQYRLSTSPQPLKYTKKQLKILKYVLRTYSRHQIASSIGFFNYHKLAPELQELVCAFKSTDEIFRLLYSTPRLQEEKL